MLRISNVVSHEWERRSTLQKYREGKVLIDDICDADFLLKTAARYHGRLTPRPCPICGHDALRQVTWVYGDNLGRRSGTARDDDEIEQLVGEVGPITAHEVEVCPDCGWNFLLSEAVVSRI